MRFARAVRTLAAVLPLLTTLLAPTTVHADARPVLEPPAPSPCRSATPC
ncbi:hypothetical protein [Streptomyces bottropensis]